jgi:heme/copper-type cytochrome/quinol oxidase subunit 3
MVLAIEAAAAGRQRALKNWLLATAFLGIAFVCIKGYGWYLDQQDQVVSAFNFCRHTLHALHLLIGIA